MKHFLLGLLLGSVAPAAAEEVQIHCQPVLRPSCGNHLKMYFEGHTVPFRCRNT